MRTVEIVTLEDLAREAREIATHITQKKDAFVITLRGDLGVGKTAFVKLLGAHLGVEEEITSPTFVIMKSYPIAYQGFTTFTHIDAYRVEHEEEMRVLGFEALCTDPLRVMCIEWPEKIPHLIPRDVLEISVTLHDNHTRTLSYGTA